MNRLCEALFPGAHVFVPGMSGESAVLLAELAADPERAREVHFIGVQFPGIGVADYLSLHATARQTAFFMSPLIRRGLTEHRAELLSFDYPGIARHLASMNPVDVAYVQVTPPDAHGNCSVGLCSDFLPIVWESAKRRIAHVNPALPRTQGSFTVRMADLDDSIEAEVPPLTYTEQSATEVERRIANHVATLIRDGDTLQFGVGTVPAALAGALAQHRGLRIHSGMISGTVRQLWEAGALDRDAQITTGVALGGADFYRFVGEMSQLWLTDVRETHDIRRIASIAGFVAINSALEVDLFGQVNSELAAGALQAGPGGLPAFMRGALLSEGGRSLICLPATAKRGSRSRIVPALDRRAVCTVPRYLADIVVTEHGIADIRNLSLNARALALIEIAAPEHRDTLMNDWDPIQRSL